LKGANRKKFENKQGPSILKEVFLSKPNYLSLHALSSMDSKILLKIRERYNMKVLTFSKEDVKTESGFNVFCDIVHNEGQKMFETICNLPGEDNESWYSINDKKTQPYNLYYKAFRMSEDFETEEIRIGNEAEKMYLDRINYKENFQEIMPHKYSFTAALTEGIENLDDINKFKEKLIGRRAYLAFRFKGKIHNSQIISALLNKNPSTFKSKSGKFPTDFFSSFLCMPEDMYKMPSQLTEERNWLINEMSFDFDEMNRKTYNEILDVIMEDWNDEVTSLKELEQVLKNTINNENKIKIHLRIKNFFDTKDRKKINNVETYDDFCNRYALSGVFELLKKCEIAPIRKTKIRDSYSPVKSGKSFQSEEEQESITDFDPDSPEGRAKLENLEPNSLD
jgi:hypothetical protein